MEISEEKTPEDHAKELKKYLDYDDAVLIELAYGLLDAKNSNQNFPQNQLGFSEKEDCYTTLHRGLSRLANRKGQTGVALAMIEKAVNHIPDFDLEFLQTIDSDLMAESLKPENYTSIIFKDMALSLREQSSEAQLHSAKKLESVIAKAMADINRPGKGRARRQAKVFNRGITVLARWFEEAQNKHKATSHESSPFYEYVYYWMTEVMNYPSSISDPTRHIDNALSFKCNWQKISF